MNNTANAPEFSENMLQNLFLLPRNFSISYESAEVHALLQASRIFRNLHELEMGIRPILIQMEDSGLLVSDEWFEEGMLSTTQAINQVANEIGAYIPVKKNCIKEEDIASFFEKYNLPVPKGMGALQQYREIHPLYKLLLAYKTKTQFHQQWGNTLLAKGTQCTKGVLLKGHWQSYASYSGRIFAKQLPLTALPKEMRPYFIAPDGYKILSLDLSNAELRFLAYFSDCHAMLDQFNDGQDIHQLTGDLISMNLGSSEVCDTDRARSFGKVYAFSMLYGAGVGRIAKNFRKILSSVTSADVSRITTAFQSTYPELQFFTDKQQRSDKLLTPFGEICPLAQFTPTQKRNFSLQSSVAVAIKILMMVASEYFRVVHVVHDEIWIHAPATEQPESDQLNKMVIAYEKQILELFPGFPIKGLINVEEIGGTNHVK